MSLGIHSQTEFGTTIARCNCLYCKDLRQKKFIHMGNRGQNVNRTPDNQPDTRPDSGPDSEKSGLLGPIRRALTDDHNGNGHQVQVIDFVTYNGPS